MKTLIESSIKLKGIGPQDTKTVFDLILPNVLPENPTPEELEKYTKDKYYNDTINQNGEYKALTSIVKRKILISFDFIENDIVSNFKVMYIIPELNSDEEIKDNIIYFINNSLK